MKRGIWTEKKIPSEGSLSSNSWKIVGKIVAKGFAGKNGSVGTRAELPVSLHQPEDTKSHKISFPFS